MFYRFRQNNTWGRYTFDNDLLPVVYIEAFTPEVANAVLEEMGGYFNGVAAGVDCRCCGDRWYAASLASLSVLDLDFPTFVGPLAGAKVAVHYGDGTVSYATSEGKE